MLQEVKDYLNITWTDETTDNKLKRFIDGGKSYLSRKTQVQLDFASDLEASQLLMDYCRYAYNHSLEDFYNNFGQDIFDLSLKYGVDDHEETST